jgi:hypothetical protein
MGWPICGPSVSVSVSVRVRGAPILRPRPWLRPGLVPWRKAMRLRPAVALARSVAKKKAGPVREPAFDGGQLLSATAFFVLSVYFMRETLVSVPIR